MRFKDHTIPNRPVQRPKIARELELKSFLEPERGRQNNVQLIVKIKIRGDRERDCLLLNIICQTELSEGRKKIAPNTNCGLADRNKTCFPLLHPEATDEHYLEGTGGFK